MACLRIRMFGDFQLTLGERPLPPFPTRESQLIFCFLALHRNRFYPREALVDAFFAEQPAEVARKRLRTAIWRIRSILEPKEVRPGTYLTVTNRDLGFNMSSDHWLDVQEFESLVTGVTEDTDKVLDADGSAKLDRALELYRGDLLEGVYDEWCLWEQERLKLLLLRILEMQMHHAAAKEHWQDAIIRGQQLLSHDPLREHIHRNLMRYYYLIGDRPAALRQYDSCARLLRDELGVDPMRETTELVTAVRNECAVARLRDESIEDRVAMIGPRSSSSAENTGLELVYESIAQLDDVRLRLRRGIRLVERFIDRAR